MEIRTTYKGITKDGVKGIWCGFKPDDIEVTEELQILYPDKVWFYRIKQQKKHSLLLFLQTNQIKIIMKK